jgi:hypothetical protein
MHIPIALATSGNHTLLRAVANRCWRVHRLALTAAGASVVGVTFLSDTTEIFWGVAAPCALDKSMTAGFPGVVLPACGPSATDQGWFQTRVGEALIMSMDANIAVGGGIEVSCISPDSRTQ